MAEQSPSPSYPSFHVFQMLNQMYEKVETLEGFMGSLVKNSSDFPTLIEPNDKPTYKALLSTTLVATPASLRQAPPTLTFSHSFHQSEIILRVVEKIKKRDGSGKNLLTLGFNLKSENPHTQISTSAHVEYSCPNQNVSRFLYASWKTLLDRIGDEVMTYLLETQSIFILIPPSCYIQVTGTPIYDLSPFEYPSGFCIDLASRKRKPDFGTHSITRAKKRKIVSHKQRTSILPAGEKIPKTSWYLKPFNRLHMFYAKDLRERTPASYILNTQAADEAGALVVLRDALDGTDVTVATQDEVRPVNLIYTELIPLFVQLLKNHKKCKYSYILDGYQPVSKKSIPGCSKKKNKDQLNVEAPIYLRESTSQSIDSQNFGNVGAKGQEKPASDKTRETNKGKISDLLQDYIPHRQVFLFIRQLLLKVIPYQLWGSKHNRNIFEHNLKKFIALGKFEKWSLGLLMKKVKISSCAWLKKSELSFNQQEEIVAKLLFWLLNSFVIMMLKSFFYITDSTVYRNRIFYYRKIIWEKIRTMAVEDFLKKGMLKPISQMDAKHLLTSGRSMGLSYLRFLPKGTSLRPIVNMGKKILSSSKTLGTINKQLQNLQQVLTFEKDRDRRHVGYSVFGIDDIYVAFKNFCLRRKTQNDERPLYFVKADIEGCYDSINQQKLFSIMSDLFEKQEDNGEEYVVRKFAKVYLAGDKVKRTFQKRVTTLSDFTTDFNTFVRREVKSKHLTDTIVIDQVLHNYEQPSSLLKKLHSHLFCNIIKVGKQHYLQIQGISQGALTSTLLSAFYYGSMERSHVHILDDELLMRQVDDFLFITPHPNKALQFLRILFDGVADYNCKVNKEKCLINFPLEGQPVSVLPEDTFFPWCGLQIDTTTLEVRMDYTRYAGSAISDTLTRQFTNHPGEAMKNKIFLSVRRSCNGLILDPQICSRAVLGENIYKLLLLTAFKFHCLARILPYKQRVINNPSYFIAIISDIPTYVISQIRQKIKQVSGHPFMKVCSVTWLCLEAFLVKFSIHQGAYFPIIKTLNAKKRNLEKQMTIDQRQPIILDQESEECSFLKEVVGRGLPIEFTKILD